MHANDAGKPRRRRRTDPGAARGEFRRRFGLTETEAKVAECLLAGSTYGNAARRLGMFPNTVHSHVKVIHRKAGVATTLDLAALFYASEESPSKAPLTRSGDIDRR
jgi:DNA-binding CsgD family transcriptional regulator